MPQALDCHVALDVFEGPLDLLLHLVKKHELEILEIPVAFIADRYLEYLDLMRQLNLDVASEYLVMAATLAHLKSRELVPSKDPADLEENEDGELVDPREELIRRLLEYQKYKQAAAELLLQPVVGRNVWLRGAAVEGPASNDDAPLAEVPVFRLVELLADVLKRARVKLSHEVIVERLSITDRINELVDRLEREGSFSFRSCFDLGTEEDPPTPEQLKHHVVVTFLAVLEMARLKLIRITQADERSDILVTRAVEDIRGRAPGAESDYR